MFDWESSPQWTSDHKLLLLSDENRMEPTENVKLADVIDKSSHFPIDFPVQTIRCSQLTNKTSNEILERNINSAYSVIHEFGLFLCTTFLLYKKKTGANGNFYKDTSLIQLIDRLLSERAVAFLGPYDDYLLLNGKTGAGKWEKIGTSEETPPLILEECLSYDEIKLSALLSISSYTFFINDGDRYNNGTYDEDRQKIEENGIIIGLIGTRFEKTDVMEYSEIIKSKEQNTISNGYGNSEIPTLQGEFLKFYGDDNYTYDELVQQMQLDKHRYVKIGPGQYFDTLMYQRRITISIDTLLLEANDRAKKENKTAYIHVVGLGLGVWKIYDGQNKLFLDTFAQRLERLSEVLTNVSDIRFAYIRRTSAGKYQNGDKVNGIKLHMIDSNPHGKLTGDDEGKLLVVSYAWDGNAFPGNEFWLGSLSGSGDPAAACSTQVAELHNWYINRKVNGGNLRVATLQGLVTFQEYQQVHKND